MKKAERLHALTDTLRRSGSHGCTANQLATEFDVSVRTVKRDLDALENSGVPIWARPGPGGGYGIANSANLPPITLSYSQAVALLAAVSAAPDAPYSDLAATAIHKIMDVLDPPTRERAHQLASRIWVNTEKTGTRVVRSALEQSLADQRIVRIRYTDKSGATTIREIEPVIFASTNGRWYVIGWCQLREAMRWFLISSIKQATVTKMPYTQRDVVEIGAPPATAKPIFPSVP